MKKFNECSTVEEKALCVLGLEAEIESMLAADGLTLDDLFDYMEQQAEESGVAFQPTEEDNAIRDQVAIQRDVFKTKTQALANELLQNCLNKKSEDE